MAPRGKGEGEMSKGGHGMVTGGKQTLGGEHTVVDAAVVHARSVMMS